MMLSYSLQIIILFDTLQMGLERSLQYLDSFLGRRRLRIIMIAIVICIVICIVIVGERRRHGRRGVGMEKCCGCGTQRWRDEAHLLMLMLMMA
jgi:hypothetical protein